MWSLVAKDRGLLKTVSNNSKIRREDFTLVAIYMWSLISGGR